MPCDAARQPCCALFTTTSSAPRHTYYLPAREYCPKHHSPAYTQSRAAKSRSAAARITMALLQDQRPQNNAEAIEQMQ